MELELQNYNMLSEYNLFSSRHRLPFQKMNRMNLALPDSVMSKEK